MRLDILRVAVAYKVTLVVSRNRLDPAMMCAQPYVCFFLFLIFACFVAWPAAQAGQSDPCDPQLRPLAGHMGYIWRGDRCEGLYLSPVAADDLELVSLVQGKLHFDLQPKTRLQVSAPPIADLAHGPVRIRAVALPLRTY